VNNFVHLAGELPEGAKALRLSLLFAPSIGTRTRRAAVDQRDIS
jgi:hypothetical protein